MKKDKEIVILGAGPAGLAAAWNFAEKGRNDVAIFEKNDKVGGIMRSKEINGNIFDYGAHYFHVDDKELLSKVLNLLDGDYTENKRNLQIKFKGAYFQYPLRINDLIRGFSPFELTAFALSMFYAIARNKITNARLVTAEDALISNYGRKLYREFFEDYIKSFWGVHPSRLSAIFALRRIPKMDVLIILKKLLALMRLVKDKRDKDKFIENVEGNLYYPTSGMGQIWDKILERIVKNGTKVYIESQLKHILTQGDRVDSIMVTQGGGSIELKIGSLISTIPLYDLLNSFKNPDEDVLNAARELKYRSLIILGMLVDKEKLLPSYCAYFRGRTFSRLSEPKLAGLKVVPSHNTVLLAEISCDFNDETWNNQESATASVIEDLEKEGIVERKYIKEIFVLKERHAYPIFDVGYEERVGKIRNYLKRYKNLYSTGRQGLFQYINSHVAMKAGFSTSECLMQNGYKENTTKNRDLFF